LVQTSPLHGENNTAAALPQKETRALRAEKHLILNIIRKLALNVLKIFETGKKSLSLKMKRFVIGINLRKHLENILERF